MSRTKEEVNKDINKILAKHKVQPLPGDESFWEAVEHISKINVDDEYRLFKLASEWGDAS